MNLQEGSRPEDGIHGCDQNPDFHVDFHLQMQIGKLSPSKSLLDYSHPLVRALDVYREVLVANGSIAKHLGLSLFSNKLESKVCELFSSPFPYMDGANEYREPPLDRVSWLDLLKEEIPAEKFTLTATPGIYSCRIGTIVVQMPESDRDLVCSGIVSKLFRSQPDALDVETEKIARSHLATDLISLYEESLRSKYGTSLFSMSLTNDYSHGTY